ncbi:hypothetical protein P692DRAFT_201392240 [Suillus brevipes Sb2]|nr:hypothetical protein P692DRAFT_201392240 [Suillus brevipes Sb2]
MCIKLSSILITSRPCVRRHRLLLCSYGFTAELDGNMLVLFYVVSPQFKWDCITAQTSSTEEVLITQSTTQRGVPDSSGK